MVIPDDSSGIHPFCINLLVEGKSQKGIHSLARYQAYIVPKIALLVFLYSSIDAPMSAPFAAICFIVGSIGLSGQWQIGRFIAFSAIVHLGYFLMAHYSS